MGAGSWMRVALFLSQIRIGDYPFSAYAKFPEDLYFLAPDMHTHVCVCVCVLGGKK